MRNRDNGGDNVDDKECWTEDECDNDGESNDNYLAMMILIIEMMMMVAVVDEVGMFSAMAIENNLMILVEN